MCLVLLLIIKLIFFHLCIPLYFRNLHTAKSFLAKFIELKVSKKQVENMKCSTVMFQGFLTRLFIQQTTMKPLYNGHHRDWKSVCCREVSTIKRLSLFRLIFLKADPLEAQISGLSDVYQRMYSVFCKHSKVKWNIPIGSIYCAMTSYVFWTTTDETYRQLGLHNFSKLNYWLQQKYMILLFLWLSIKTGNNFYLNIWVAGVFLLERD